MVVNGERRESSLAPILANISLHCVASLPAVLLCAQVPAAKYALQGIKWHVFGKQRRRSASD